MAAVDVEAVALGVDEEVVEGEGVDAGGEDGEVAAVEDGEVAEQDVEAVLEADGLVAYAGLLGDEGVVAEVERGGAVGEAFAVDEAGAGDGEVVDAFAVEEGVGPVVVAVVLVGLPRLGGAGGVVGAAHVAGGLAGLG